MCVISLIAFNMLSMKKDMKMNNLKKVHDLGQSIWLDFFNREIMDNGMLQNLIDEDSLSGITSNPSIFESAVLSRPDYDDDIKKFSGEQKSNEDIFFEFAISDIKRAADILKPVYEKANGRDGLVSMEVSTLLANDTEGSIKQDRKSTRLNSSHHGISYAVFC